MKSVRATSTRADWRDPDMPVLRNYHSADDGAKEYVHPNYERRYREHMLNNTCEPSWRDDPTYNMRRRHEKVPKKTSGT